VATVWRSLDNARLTRQLLTEESPAGVLAGALFWGATSGTDALTLAGVETGAPTVAGLTVTQPSAGLSAEPIAGYSFDAQDGTDDVGARDISLSGFTASAKHGAYAKEGGLYTGTGYAFTSPPFSIAFWYYQPDGSFGVEFSVSGTNQIVFGSPWLDAYYINDGTTEIGPTANTYVRAAWNFVALGVRADGTYWLRLNDGATIESGAAATYYTQDVDRFQLDNRDIDSLAVWDVALSAGDLDWLYNSGAGRQISDLVAGAPADDLTAFGVTAGTPSAGGLTLAQAHALTPATVSAGTPNVAGITLQQAHKLTPAAVTVGAPSVGGETLKQAHALTPAGVTAGTPAIGAATLYQAHALAPAGVAAGAPEVNGLTLGEPAGTDDLTAFGVAVGAPAVGGLTLFQAHALIPAGVTTDAPTVAATTLQQAHLFQPAALNVGAPDIAALGLRQAHALSPWALSTGPPDVGATRLFLGTLELPATRSAVVPAEVRRLTIGAEVRQTDVALDLRRLVVVADVRRADVPVESRRFAIAAEVRRVVALAEVRRVVAPASARAVSAGDRRTSAIAFENRTTGV
jgi:hypothetical protein